MISPCHIHKVWIPDFPNYLIAFSVFTPYQFSSIYISSQRVHIFPSMWPYPRKLFHWVQDKTQEHRPWSWMCARFPGRPFCSGFSNHRFLYVPSPFSGQWYGSEAFNQTLVEVRVPSPCSVFSKNGEQSWIWLSVMSFYGCCWNAWMADLLASVHPSLGK